MAKTKDSSREFYNRESDGLRQRRLKDENRWKFDPNKDYKSGDDDEDDNLYEEEDNW